MAASKHHYVSTACAHGLHSRCRSTCKFCATACECKDLLCDHDVYAVAAENRLQIRIALALHEAHGFHQGTLSAWKAAEAVMKTLKEIDPEEECP